MPCRWLALLAIPLSPFPFPSLGAQQRAPACAPAPTPTIEFTGQLLVNGFYNSAGVNNSDVPQLALQDTTGASGAGGTVRQTRLGVSLTEPNVLGGRFSGELDVDFFGGQQPSGGGRTFPLLRLRRAVGTLAWRHVEILVGQESPLVADREPRSLAAIGFPDLAGAGNLWLWLPQARATYQTGYTLRLALEGAVLAPTAGTPQGAFLTQPDSAERSGRPYLQGRVRLGWGPPDDPSEIAVGGHVGWLRGLDSLANDSLITSQAVTVGARVKLGILELMGEAFTGQALAGLGGGGVGQSIGASGAAVETMGGWGQLNIRPNRTWLVGGGCGIDDPDDATLLATGIRKNVVCEGHLHWRSGPLVAGFEFRRFATTYPAGEFTANHVNVAAGYRF